ncbi:MAG: hypothetical protein A4E32_00637 [Methanomassiliicoccales archaeon PtaU1.Bin124]|nr:MAG: hypothetical protein A4E32_00637 [Methanomassiliicoccales archaeon PtaU1.Bin124]
MDRKIVVAVVALVLCIAIAAFVYPYLTKEPERRSTLVDVYILSWDLNTTDVSNGIDVKFIISIDTDGDMAFDVVRESGRMNGTIGEIAPFHLGAIISQEQQKFYFRVTAVEIIDEAARTMRYTADGTIPTLNGDNVIGGTGSWAYDATDYNSDGLACRISFAYIVGEAN